MTVYFSCTGDEYEISGDTVSCRSEALELTPSEMVDLVLDELVLYEVFPFFVGVFIGYLIVRLSSRTFRCCRDFLVTNE